MVNFPKCEKCGIEGSDKLRIWVYSSALNGFGETPKLCSKCRDKLNGFLAQCFKRFISEE